MLLQEGLLVFNCLVTLAASAAVKVPPEAGWANMAPKSVYSRALGPPISGMDAITVPYMSKSPLFPKFVDPRMMISKKTDLLSNLFGGLGPAYPPNFIPSVPYSSSATSLYSVGGEADSIPSKVSESLLQDTGKTKPDDVNTPYKRGIFGPFSPKLGPMGSMGPMGPMGSMGPMGPKFGPMGPKFGPMSQFAGSDMTPDYGMKGAFSRKRRSIDESSVANLRSIMDDGKPTSKDLGPPPPYPTLPPISEEPEEKADLYLKKLSGASTPTEYMPGMFGPFGPIIDPSMFIAKKSAFLDTLFQNIATSTAAPITTDAPVATSTIVPPSFWFPASIVPSPTEYNEKVLAFLDKLFESIKLNKTAASEDESLDAKSDFARSVKSDIEVTQGRIARSVQDLASINAAKDTIVDSILGELGDLKSDMMTTMNDLIAYEKSSSASMAPKKPFKPFAPGMWPKPSIDVTLPFQQRMTVLSQVFDMLTDLQKNITVAIQNSIKAKMASSDVSGVPTNVSPQFLPQDVVSTTGNLPVNVSLLDAIKSKLATLDTAAPAPYALGATKIAPKKVRMAPKTPSSFWVSYPEDMASTIKREVNENPMDTSIDEPNESSHRNQKQYTRSVKMQMHQGYQSLPAGSIESVQAGGGSVPGHQGGGIKLLDTSGYGDIEKWMDWMQYLKNENQGHRHHNHH